MTVLQMAECKLRDCPELLTAIDRELLERNGHCLPPLEPEPTPEEARRVAELNRLSPRYRLGEEIIAAALAGRKPAKKRKAKEAKQ